MDWLSNSISIFAADSSSTATTMESINWLKIIISILAAAVLIALNGFFVAAEFALVKVRGTQMDLLLELKRPFAKTASWLVKRMDGALSACQLGITMASLALGWVAEPAFVKLFEPFFEWAGVPLIAKHAVAVTIAFTLITALHLVIGEQVPKIFAIRRPETMVVWCALPLKVFYLLTWPLMLALNKSTSFLLRLVGITGASDHDMPHTEDEIRSLVRQSRVHGELTSSEQQLIHAVFEFDDMTCRQIMVPRSDVDFFDINDPIADCIESARRTKHTRYPVCDDSLDNVLGVVHVKDLVGLKLDESFDWKSIMRPPRKVPGNMLISKLLRHFQGTHQLMAFAIDEYGMVKGVVTLENVLEQIVGAVQDEFDSEQPNIVPDGDGRWIVTGSTPVVEVAARLEVNVGQTDAETLSGLLMQRVERMLTAGDRIEFDGFFAEVLETRDDRALNVRVSLKTPPSDESATATK